VPIAITTDQRAFAGAAAAFAARVAPVDDIRKLLDASPRLIEDRVWKQLVSQGFTSMHLPDESGEAATLVDIGILMEQAGRRLLPGPLLPSVLTSLLVHRHGSGTTAARDLVEAFARGARGACALSAGQLSAADTGDGWMLSGTSGLILGAPGAEYLLLGATAGPEELWFAVPAADVEIHEVPGIDATRTVGTVRCSAVRVASQQRITVTTAQVRAAAAVLFAAEAAGIAQWCQETGLAYAKIREQFGHPIGSFQAVKHKCARIFVTTELMAAAVWDAATASAQDAEQFELAAAAAAVTCLQPAVDLCLDTVTLLGAIGNTWEHDVHLYWRRAIALNALLGPAQDHARTVAALSRRTQRSRAISLDDEPPGFRQRIAATLRAVAAEQPGRRQAALADAGLVSPQYPAPYGTDAGPAEQFIIAEELQRAGLEQPSTLIGEWALPTIIVHGDEAQRDRFVMPTLRGDIVWCQLFSEPGAGSDLASLRLRAERADGGWVLNGQKVWSSNAHLANWGICLARTDPDAPKHKGISYFLVDMSSPGLTVRRIREANGESMFNETFFDDVLVPDDCLVGQPHDGWRLARTTLGNERLSIGGMHGSRKPPARIAADAGASGPDIEFAIGSLTAEFSTLDAMAQRIAVRSLNGLESAPDGAVLKLVSSQVAARIGNFALLCGGPGAAVGDGPAASLLSAPRVLIGGGTVEMQLNMIGERILGLPRS
jgi:alkylation response protein AidB-like acyl-CoA dehydrogenase